MAVRCSGDNGACAGADGIAVDNGGGAGIVGVGGPTPAQPASASSIALHAAGARKQIKAGERITGPMRLNGRQVARRRS